MSVLDAIGSHHGTDKAAYGHNYLHWYERFLAPWRDREFTILEIGVGSGISLMTWRDYFPRASIIGMDIVDKREYARERIEIIIGDQSVEADLARVAEMGPFGIIVDDAGHNEEHQVLSHRKLLSSLMPEGLYVLEDIGGDFCLTYLLSLASRVMRCDGQIESIAFYGGTSITTIKGPLGVGA